jgi:hypothetical protein
MALKIRSLVLLSSSPHTADSASGKVWWYTSADAAATVVAAGYFNDARGKLSVNDLIICMCVVGGTGVPVFVKPTAVPSSGNVTVTSNTPALA